MENIFFKRYAHLSHLQWGQACLCLHEITTTGLPVWRFNRQNWIFWRFFNPFGDFFFPFGDFSIFGDFFGYFFMLCLFFTFFGDFGDFLAIFAQKYQNLVNFQQIWEKN